MLPTIALVLSAQLSAVQVDVRLQLETAVVRVSYQLPTSDAGAAFTLIRLPEQLVWFTDPGLALEEREGLTRIVAPWGGPVVLAYTVQGPLDRIPIPVPEGSLPANSGGVTITVEGLDPGARLAGGFPRLVAGRPGAGSAHLVNVPSLIQLPPTGSPWTAALIAQVTMLLLPVAGGFLFWRRRAQGRAA